MSSKRILNPDGPGLESGILHNDPQAHCFTAIPQDPVKLAACHNLLSSNLPTDQFPPFTSLAERRPLILVTSLRSVPVWSHSALCHRKFTGCNSLKLFNSESSNAPAYLFIMTKNNIDRHIQLGNREGLYFSSSQTPPSPSASSCCGDPIALSHKTPLSLNLQPSLDLDIRDDKHSSSASTYGSNDAWTPEYFMPLDLCCDCCPSQKDDNGNKSNVELIRCIESSALGARRPGQSPVDSSHASLREHDDLSQKVGRWANRASEICNG